VAWTSRHSTPPREGGFVNNLLYADKLPKFGFFTDKTSISVKIMRIVVAASRDGKGKFLLPIKIHRSMLDVYVKASKIMLVLLPALSKVYRGA
jgi:hypothetical protein